MDPIHRRNAGLRRIVRITKAAVAGGLVLTGGLSALAARSFSGTSTAAAQSTIATSTPATKSTTQSTTNTTTPALQSPSYSIGSSSGSGRVTSGGS
ncbi:MAG: hypothetical protein JOZ04_08305 [Acidimicrobiia bacterium]|nr:hypothetical protein [Acidimicrobiia bacterium]